MSMSLRDLHNRLTIDNDLILDADSVTDGGDLPIDQNPARFNPSFHRSATAKSHGCQNLL
jgi:hypothetical protein